jgi:truncated hemoglobin YjbI
MRSLLYQILESFYQKATTDVMIGHHFNKFQDPEVLKHHLERITSFWELQLTGETTVPLERGFQLLFTHLQLNIKKGELGRWVVLFHQTLDEYESKIDHPQMKNLSEVWKQRVKMFEERFRSHPKMFNA